MRYIREEIIPFHIIPYKMEKKKKTKSILFTFNLQSKHIYTFLINHQLSGEIYNKVAREILIIELPTTKKKKTISLF